MIEMIVQLVAQAVEEVPALVTEFQNIFANNTPPTDAQWQALYAKIQSEQIG